MSAFTKAEKLPDNEKLAMTEMRAGMMWAQPFFSHLLLDQCELVPSYDVPIAATDGRKIFVNPTKMAEWTLKQRIYLLSHEVMHVAWEHMEQAHMHHEQGIPGPKGLMAFDDELCNEVQDWSINALLDECKVGERPPVGCFNPRIKGGESWVKIYAEEWERRKNQPKNPNQQPGNNPGNGNSGGQGPGKPNPQRMDQHLPPGAQSDKTPQQAVKERAERADEMRQALSQAMAVAKARGDVPEALVKMIGELIEVKTDWKDRLAALVTRTIGGGRLDWEMPELPLMVFPDPVFMPSRAGTGVGTMVIARDTSGSIYADPKALEVFGGCMAGIFEQAKPERVIVIDCDARVKRVEELEEPTDIDAVELSRQVTGGGGTRFEPVFEWCAENDVHPDCLVYLTDGEGSAPREAPGYQVVWAMLPGCKNQCGWGDEVVIEV